MSTLTLAEKISARLLNSPTKLVIRVGDDQRIATLQDLRDYLALFGLDITTERALAWGISNPIQAEHIDRICELSQHVDELQAELDEIDHQRGSEALPVPIEKKEAAE